MPGVVDTDMVTQSTFREKIVHETLLTCELCAKFLVFLSSDALVVEDFMKP